jgi:hypothetical protein
MMRLLDRLKEVLGMSETTEVPMPDPPIPVPAEPEPSEEGEQGGAEGGEPEE